ncbi:type II toxin-antitoxin system VapC family toxin [Acidobacteria bacterium AB60]|nr:type II toxin-antitoxin system VapC family toxin [Acidobacteria bacterium AB60]
MIGLDSNTLLRFILKDDPLHTPRARAVLHALTPQDPGWIGIGTLFEIVWVLTQGKKLPREAISHVLTELLLLDTLIFEQDEVLESALLRFRTTNADLSDCLIAASAKAAGCRITYTFDRIAARDAGMELAP